MRRIKVRKEEVGNRKVTAKQYLRHFGGISSTLWKRIKHSGTFTLNGVPAIAARITVQKNDVITYDISKVSHIAPEKIRLDIRFEDSYLLIINKPAGLLVHPTPKTFTGTLANGVLKHYHEIGETHDFHPIHRLDMDTSGLVIIAKEPEVQYLLMNKTGKKEILREYLAIINGNLQSSQGTIDAPIARALPSIIARKVSAEGKKAVTHYRTLLYDGTHSLLQLQLETGRTHQIRVHMAYLGHPLIGDTLYGGNNEISRQALHAYRISLIHPITHLPLNVYAPLPLDMTQILTSSSKA